MQDIHAQFPSLAHALTHFAKTQPSNIAIRFFADGEIASHAVSYYELDQACRAIAHELTPYEGKTAVLIYQPGVDFLFSFFSCLYAGVIAVPAYPPRKNHNLDRLINIINDCQPSVILSTTQQRALSEPLCEAALPDTHLHWLDTDSISPQLAAGFTMPDLTNGLAFLQYTSGSTGEPKGVMVSHKNLITNFDMAKTAYQIPTDAHCVSWLPLYHDMGLIGAVMMPLYWGAGTLLMPPNAFLQKPLRFLQLVHKYGQYTPIGATQPNFAYQLLIDQVDEGDLEGLDLSNWCFAMTGAEPIRADTLTAFAEKYSPTGFNKQVFRPAFGMAECTLLSTCSEPGTYTEKTLDAAAFADNHLVESTATSALTLVSAGKNIPPQKLRIVDPQTLATLDEGKVGEIWLKGAHIARGYWQNPEATEATFNAFTAEDKGPYMRTGDLGSLLDGEIFIAGRLKDLIIIRGKNHYPQDIELTVASACSDTVSGSIAALQHPDFPGEKLLIIAELQRSARKGFDADCAGLAIQQAITQAHGIDTAAVVFIRFASLPKTSSGKIQHYLALKQFKENSLKKQTLWLSGHTTFNVNFSPNCSFNELSDAELTKLFTDFFESTFNTPCQSVTRLDSFGLDSMQWLTLIQQVENWSRLSLDASNVFQMETIAQLSHYLLSVASQTKEDSPSEIEGAL